MTIINEPVRRLLFEMKFFKFYNHHGNDPVFIRLSYLNFILAWTIGIKCFQLVGILLGKYDDDKIGSEKLNQPHLIMGYLFEYEFYPVDSNHRFISVAFIFDQEK